MNRYLSLDKYQERTNSARGHSGESWDFRESIGMSFLFQNAKHLFGIPERADTFLLRTTENSDPYRLYNLDVFPHSTYEPEGLYGSIPYLTAHTKNYDASILWMNAAETWVDIFKTSYLNAEGRLTNFVSESGKMEFFIIASASKEGNHAHRVQKLLQTIVGF